MNAQDPLLAELREVVDHLEVPPGLDADRMARRAVRRVRARRVALAGGTGALALVLAVGGVQALPELVDRPLTGAVLPGGPGPSETVPRAADGAADRVRVWLGPVVVSLPADWETVDKTIGRAGYHVVRGRTGEISQLSVEVDVIDREESRFGWQNLSNTLGEDVTFPDIPGAGLTVMRVAVTPERALRAVLTLRTATGERYEVTIGDVPITDDGHDILQDVVDHLRVEREAQPGGGQAPQDLPAELPAGFREIEVGRLRLGVPEAWRTVEPWVDDPGAVMVVSREDGVDGPWGVPAVIAVRPTPSSAAWMVSGRADFRLDGARRVIVTHMSESYRGDPVDGKGSAVDMAGVRIDVELDDGALYTVHLELPLAPTGDYYGGLPRGHHDLIPKILGSLRVAD
ncbi:hypothetical protein [Isoptericola sediminis]|uniref:Uncharacterized protein n=1 Tax=Isoptericola sediminis TaxID=2733572 RepID=A0A849KFD8_9MICO|nr:hypothetical protein [Isoptericola sediminis]NNU27283.1 hypothetical protein [Isoptericola sediminis]